jgi:hypothetical protein
MRKILALATASAVALAAFCTIASAETSAERMQKAPTKSLGDEGKLPPTNSMSGQVQDQTGPRTAASPADEQSGASGPKGPPSAWAMRASFPPPTTSPTRSPT